MAFKKQKQEPQEQPQAAPQVSLVLNSQYIKDLSLEIPHAPQIFKKLTQQPSLKVDVNVESNNVEQNGYTVDVNFSINADVEDEKLFILELTYSAFVTLVAPKEHIEPILNIEIPRLTFPFARNIIAQCLMESGLPPIMMNPIDFAALYAARHSANANN